MREFTGPGEVQIRKDTNVTEGLWERERLRPTAAALSHRVGSQFVDVTTRQFADRVRQLARGLIGLGVAPGDRVAILSSTRIEWTYLDYAIWAAGAVTVPLYETSSAEQVAWILGDSETVAAFVETPEHKATFEEVADQIPACKHLFVIEEAGLDTLAGHGEAIDPAVVTARATAATTDDLATLVYTSGTTGPPKGCMLTHGNLLWVTTQVAAATDGLFSEGTSTLLFLPLAHIFGRIVQCTAVRQGMKLGYASSVTHLAEELPLFRPTFLLSVPRVFEKLYNGATAKAQAEGKGAIFARATQAAIDYSRAKEADGVPLGTRLLHGLFDKLVYTKLRAAVGGQVRYAISGGAALGERLGHFFTGVGIPVLEGYGLTETAAGATLNTPRAARIGTVGRPLPGCTIRIADDGEVLVKGGSIFQGYWRNAPATREAIDQDGWFCSGDIGRLDDGGYLSISGRKKELIVTAAGKNVAPAVLEDRLRSQALISQAMVVGDGRPFIAALITIDQEELPRWLKEHGKEDKTLADLTDDPALRNEIQRAVDQANRAVSRAESIREFRILPDDFTIEGGELTPTLKIKRNIVADRYTHAIEDVYR